MVDKLLALCARAQSNPAMLEGLATQARRYAGWATLPERAESIGMAPLALEHLQTAGMAIPEEARQALLALTLRHRRANLIRSSVLAEILSALEEVDIGVLVLKGAALANTVYPLSGLRPMRDMDILVRERDGQRAQAKLFELGFKPEHRRIGGEEAQHHLPPVIRPSDGLSVSIEVHRHLLPFAAGSAYEDLADEALSFSVGGVPAQTLSHQDMLWHIYRHAFRRPLIAQPIRLIWVADFVSLVEKYVDEIEWAKLRRKFPEVWNVLPVFHFLTPWSEKTLETLNIRIEPPPKGIGQTFQGWPGSSLAVQRQKGLRRFLVDTFWPSEWWTQLYYGVGRPSLRWWWTRLVGHPLHIAGWLLQYLRNRRPAT